MLDNVVAHASGGRALRAFKIQGAEAPVIGLHVLETPPDVAIRGPVEPQRTEELSFIDTATYKEFFDKVSTSGWSAAVHVDLGWRLGSLKISGNAKKEDKEEVLNQRSKKVRNVVVTQCLFVPMKSFQIPQSQMFLTKAVIADAKAVSNDEGATNFLNKYNTHVYAGLYHIGGIFMKEVSITSSEEVQAGFLIEKALLEVGVSAELKYSGLVEVKADATFSYITSNEVHHKVSSEVKLLKSEERIHVWGATSATDKNDFMKKLEADPSKWAIIDKAFEHPHDLIGIWDIMAKYEDLKEPAEIIYKFYQNKNKEKTTTTEAETTTTE